MYGCTTDKNLTYFIIPQFYCYFNNNLPLNAILIKITTVHTFTSYFSNMNYNILSSMPVYPTWSLASSSAISILYLLFHHCMQVSNYRIYFMKSWIRIFTDDVSLTRNRLKSFKITLWLSARVVSNFSILNAKSLYCTSLLRPILTGNFSSSRCDVVYQH